MFRVPSRTAWSKCGRWISNADMANIGHWPATLSAEVHNRSVPF